MKHSYLLLLDVCNFFSFLFCFSVFRCQSCKLSGFLTIGNHVRYVSLKLVCRKHKDCKQRYSALLVFIWMRVFFAPGRSQRWQVHVPIEWCFSTFFHSRYPSLLKLKFGGIPGYNLLVKQTFFRALRLRTTVLEEEKQRRESYTSATKASL